MALLLHGIHIDQYRNLREKKISFDRSLTILHGKNGVGKTNILEAIHVGISGELFRPGDITDLIPFQEKFFQYTLSFQDGEHREILSVGGEGKEKKKILNDHPIEWLHPHLSITTVVFHPADLHLLLLDPDGRRRAMINICERRSPVDRKIFSDYRRILQHRNMVLRTVQTAKQRLALDHWTELLRAQALLVVNTLTRLANDFSPKLSQLYRDTFQGMDLAEITYHPATPAHILSEPERFHQWFIDSGIAQEEIIRGFSLFGPHRDDWIFTLGQHPARIYGSRGEQRSLLLAFRCVEALLLAEAGKTPLILLDDALSELDHDRRHALLLLLDQFQRIVTTAEDLAIEVGVVQEIE